MDSKDQNTNIIYPNSSTGSNLQSANARISPSTASIAVTAPPDGSDLLSAPPTEFISPIQSLAQDQKSRFGLNFSRFLNLKTLYLVSGVILFVGGGLILRNVLASPEQSTNSSQVNSTDNYNPVELELEAFSATGSQRELSLLGPGSVTINGPLDLNSGLVVSPTLQPAKPTVGQIYYDQSVNQLRFYNGTEFVSLGSSDLSVVESIANTSGQLALGGGLSLSGNQIQNSGVISLGEQTGAIALGGGLSISGGILQNSGVRSLVSADSALTITDDGNGNLTISAASSGGGDTNGLVNSNGGTSGLIPVFTDSQTIDDSIINQSGTTISIAGSLSLNTALSVINGGTGATSLTANGVIIGGGTDVLTSVKAVGSGQCLLSTSGAPSFAACPNVGVTSLNGLTGALSVANASAASSTVTIDDASTTAKGIAQFNATNFSAAAGTVNTIQNISTTSSPTFTALNTNTITPSSALTVGATGQQLILQGNASTQLTATGGGFTTTVGFSGVPTGGINYNFDSSATPGTYTICSTTGNCVGIGGSVGGTGNQNRVAKFTATGSTIGDSTITDNGTSVSTTVDLVIQGGDLTVGVASSQTGQIILTRSDSVSTGTIVPAALGGNRTYILPDANGTICLTSGNCSGAGSPNTLQAAYDAGNSVTTTDARDIDITLANTATDSVLDIMVADDSTGYVSISRANGAGTNDPAQLLLIDNLDTNRAQPIGLKLQSAAGLLTTAIDASDAEIGTALAVGANDITGTTGNIDLTNFDVVGSSGNISSQGNINLANSGQYQINGSQISSSALSNDSNLAKLSSSQTFTGNTNAFRSGSDSTNSFNIQNSSGIRLFTADTSGSQILLGVSSSLSGQLVFNNATNNNTITIVPGTPGSNRTITLPDSTGTICLTSGNCSGAGSPNTLQAAYDAGNTITTTDARDVTITLANTATDGNVTVSTATGSTGFTTISRADGAGTSDPAQLLLIDNLDTDRAQPIGLKLQSAAGLLTTAIDASDAEIGTALSVGANTILGGAAVIDFDTFDLGSTGAVNFINSSNSTQAFNIENSTGGNLFTVDSTNTRIGIGLGGNNVPTLAGDGLEVRGSLRLSGSSPDTYTTPVGSSVGTRVSVVNQDIGAFSQIMALGVTSGSDVTSRALSLFDARTGAHQPTLSVFSPNENHIVGFSWNGSDATAAVQTNDTTAATSSHIILQSGNVSGTGSTSGNTQVNTGIVTGGTGQTSGSIFVVTGNGTGTNSSSGNVTLDSGSSTGSGTAGSINIGTANTSAINIGRLSFTTNNAGTLMLGEVGGATNATYLCRNGSNIIASCNTTGAGAAFVQGGNSFAATSVLGSNDSNALELETSGTTRLTVAANGSSVTLASNTDLLLQGASAYISNPQGQTSAEAFGLNASVTGSNGVAVGNTATATGNSSIAIGAGAGTGNTQSIAIGDSAGTGTGGRDIAIGHSSSAGGGGTTGSIALGYDTTASSAYSIALGYSASTSATQQLVIGSDADTAQGNINHVVIGSGVTDDDPNGFTLQGTSGSGTNIAGANVTVAAGQGTGSALGGNILFQSSVAGGAGASLNSLSTLATLSTTSLTMASNVDVLLQGSTAYISNPQAQTRSEVFGLSASALGADVAILGNSATAGDRSISVGSQINNTANDAIALGYGVNITSAYAIAVGAGASAGSEAIALGRSASASSLSSIAVGYAATTTAANQLVIGSSDDTVHHISHVVIGDGVTSATPNGFTLQGSSGSGTNIAGASVTVAGGQGTGTGNGGSLSFQIADPGTSGSSLNALATVLQLSGINGAALLQNTTDSTTGFRVQNAAGTTTVLNADTSNGRVGINTQAPAERLTVNGNFSIRDADSATKAYRFRTSGGSLDLEAGGSSLFISNWTGADFTGTQRNYLVLEDSVHVAQAVGTWQFRTAASGTARHIIDGTTGASIVFNDNGEATNFTIEGDTDASAFVLQGSTNRLGLGTNAPAAKLHVSSATAEPLFRVTDGTTTAVDVLNIADEGAITFQNRTNSTTAFRVLNAASVAVFSVDTTTSVATVNGAVAVSGYAQTASQGFEGVTFPPTTPGTWTTGGSVNWSRTTGQFQEGAASAGSGAIGDSQISWLDLDYTFSTAGTVKFYWKVSSEDCGVDWCDGLYLNVDNDSGNETAATYRIHGEEDWAEVTVHVGPGSHSFRWVYSKDSGAISGSDRGWIDNVRISEAGGLSANGIATVSTAAGIGTTTNLTDTLTVDGSLLLRDQDVAAKQFRARTDGAAFDTEVAGSDWVFSTYDTDQFNADNQDFQMRLYADGSQAAFFQGLWVESDNAGEDIFTVVDETGAAFTVLSIAEEGAATFKNRTNSTTGFVIQNAAATSQFTVDTTNSRTYIGNPSADTTGALLVLDTKTSAGDPTGVNGAMYYNSSLGKFRCYEQGSWMNCISGLIDHDAFWVKGTATDFVSTGVADMTNSGTLTNSNGNVFTSIKGTTAASNGATAGFISPTFNLTRLSIQPTCSVVVKSPSGGVSTGVRVAIGLFSAAPANANDFGGHHVAFKYSTVGGDTGASTGWRASTRNGTTNTIGSANISGSADMANDNEYKLKFRYDSGSSTMYMSVNGGTEDAVTATLPTTSQDLGIAAQIISTGNANEWNFSRFYCEQSPF